MKRKNYAVFMALPGNDFSTNITYGAASAVEERDDNLIIFPTGLIDNFGYEIEVSLYRYQYNILGSFLGAKSIDGAVIEYGTITAMIDAQKKERFLAQKREKMPVILLAEDAPGYASIVFDNSSGIKDVVKHFAQVHGCKRIAFLSGPRDNEDAKVRLNAYYEALDELGISRDESMVEYGCFAYEVGEYLDSLHSKHPDIEALVCANDDMAMGALDYYKKHGRKPGEDILISGFDDAPKACIQDPPLTTVKANAQKLSYKAMKAVFGGRVKDDLPSIKTELVIRKSCGCKIHTKNAIKQAGALVAKEMLYADQSIIEVEHQNHVFFGEVELLLREAIYYQDTQAEWMKSILGSFIRLGYKKAFMFFHDEPISISKYEEWKMPETINYIASSGKDEFESFEMGERVYNISEIFSSDIMESDERKTMIVIPLFYREKQLGFIVADGPLHLVRFAYQIGSMVSNAIAMIRIQQTNMRLVKELEQANHAKSQFLANMSHEIRTPINAVMGMNEMIRRTCEKADATNEECKKISEYSSDISGASNTLLSIINDILDISKIESNKMTLIPVEYNLGSFVQNLFKQVGFKTRSKEVELKLNLDENLPSVLWGDDLRIGQVLINILGNAVKYTHKGEVVLTVSGHREGELVYLDMSVKDTGIGIKQEDLKKLFEKFERIEEKRNRNIEGTGLGMSISLALLQMMGSTLKVESTYGEGSTFYFTIAQKIIDDTPIAKQKNNDESKASNKSDVVNYSGKKVLVVDDNEINRKVILFMLEDSGIEFDEAENGEECLKYMGEKEYDLVLLDHMMPVLDGMETMARIKENPDIKKGSPAIVALTANAIVGAQQEYLDAGFNAYLSKPINPDALNELLNTYLK